jgi:para-nitrobenzyl esterase
MLATPLFVRQGSGKQPGETPMSALRSILLAAALTAMSAGALAQPSNPTAAPAAAPPPAPVGLALANFPAKSGKTLTVTSPAFKAGGDIPLENTRYRGNIFPGLTWGHGPYGTRSFVIVMQDADVNFRGGPLLHWSMYALTASLSKLPAGMTTPPAGSSYGPNVRGPNQSYFGPHTPPGPKHHYHFAVFALDRDIAVDPALSWDALAADMSGHVLASGELIGLGHADPDAPPPPKPATPPAAPAAPAPPAAPPAPAAPKP